jgi:hypothetical protein
MRAAYLIAVARTYAAVGRSDAFATDDGFIDRLVFDHVPRHNDVSPLADLQIPAWFYTPSFEPRKLLDEHVRLDDHPWADDILDVARKDTRWDVVKLVDLFSGDYRVASIGSTLVSNHNIIVWSKQIDEFALGFVTPLQTDYASRWHG